MKSLIHKLIPPASWALPVILIAGVGVGLLLYTFYVSRAYSYLSDKPETCMNCHIMAPQYATWEHSSHKTVANCNDCHVPHNNFLNKYYFKAKDGMRHATIFTLRNEPQVIQILEAGRKVVHSNCIRCHKNLLDDPRMQSIDPHFNQERVERVCWDCHRETPHGRVNSLSSVPYARVPVPGSAVPAWLEKSLNSENTQNQ